MPPLSAPYKCTRLGCNHRTHGRGRGGACAWCRYAKEGGHHSGRTTDRKQENLRHALDVSVELSLGNKSRNFPFWYASLNCGSGLAEDGTWGEPLHLLTKIRERGRECKAFLCDKEIDYVSHLRRMLWGMGFSSMDSLITTQFYAMNNSRLLDIVHSEIRGSENPRFAVGLIVSDPPGFSLKSTPYHQLRDSRHKFPRLDLILNFNYGTVKRSEKVGKIPNFLGKYPFEVSVRGVTSWIDNTAWQVSKPLPGQNSNDYIVVVGRESHLISKRLIAQSERYGFVRIDSEQGQRWLRETEERCPFRGT